MPCISPILSSLSPSPAREVLGVSKGGSGRMKGAWWWSKEVKEKVKTK